MPHCRSDSLACQGVGWCGSQADRRLPVAAQVVAHKTNDSYGAAQLDQRDHEVDKLHRPATAQQQCCINQALNRRSLPSAHLTAQQYDNSSTNPAWR